MAGNLPRLRATVLATCGLFASAPMPGHWHGLATPGLAYAATAAQANRTASAAWSPLDSSRVRVWSDSEAQPGSGTQPPSGTLAAIRVTLDGHVEYHAP